MIFMTILADQGTNHSCIVDRYIEEFRFQASCKLPICLAASGSGPLNDKRRGTISFPRGSLIFAGGGGIGLSFVTGLGGWVFLGGRFEDLALAAVGATPPLDFAKLFSTSPGVALDMG